MPSKTIGRRLVDVSQKARGRQALRYEIVSGAEAGVNERGAGRIGSSQPRDADACPVHPFRPPRPSFRTYAVRFKAFN
jgi:hypothetical protein